MIDLMAVFAEAHSTHSRQDIDGTNWFYLWGGSWLVICRHPPPFATGNIAIISPTILPAGCCWRSNILTTCGNDDQKEKRSVAGENGCNAIQIEPSIIIHNTVCSGKISIWTKFFSPLHFCLFLKREGILVIFNRLASSFPAAI
jgi:hypothetical protein